MFAYLNYRSIYYIHTDHLGSYCAITSASKQVVQRNYFDPWGNAIALLRGLPPDDPQAQEQPTLNFTLTPRGFTGHEHYPRFNIINMNGRLYDPVIGRFFSPDKYVANSSFTQDFNRYSYARNCPLMYTDPDGENPALLVPLIAIAISAAVAATSYTIQVACSPGGFQNWSWEDFTFNMMLGVGCGIIGAGVGGAVAAVVPVTGFLGGLASGAAGGFASGIVNGAATGATIWKSALMGAGIGGVMGGLIGGIDAAVHKANFWNGEFTFYDALEVPRLSEAEIKQAIAKAEAIKKSGASLDTKMFELLEQEIAPIYPQYQNLGNYSTLPHDDVGYSADMYFVMKDGIQANGYTKGYWGKPTSDIRIAPARLGNIADFTSTAGHEIIHAYHFYTIPSMHWSKTNVTWSEASARAWDVHVYQQAGMHNKAYFYRGGYYPLQFRTPLHFW